MNRYRVEIMGHVPNGMTHNDIHASVLSLISETATVESIIKRRLAGGMVSLIVTFQAESVVKARTVVNRAMTGVLGFSADSFGFKDQGSI